MSEETDRLEQRLDALEQEVAELKEYSGGRSGVRKRSTVALWGLPIYDIALGPDPDQHQVRGHARGFIAMGDIATGVVAIGGIARGVIALGGLAVGILSFGGCSIGILFGFGGLAVGALAYGGLAVGLVAWGGAAVGYYAYGDVAFGKYVISSLKQAPEAIRFFGQWIPGFNQRLLPPGR